MGSTALQHHTNYRPEEREAQRRAVRILASLCSIPFNLPNGGTEDPEIIQKVVDLTYLLTSLSGWGYPLVEIKEVVEYLLAEEKFN